MLGVVLDLSIWFWTGTQKESSGALFGFSFFSPIFVLFLRSAFLILSIPYIYLGNSFIIFSPIMDDVYGLSFLVIMYWPILVYTNRLFVLI